MIFLSTKQQVDEPKGNHIMETQYTIQIDLPLPPSYSNISQEEYKVASKLRNKIQKKFGINIVLTGKMCFNPNYKVKNTWNNPEEPQTINRISVRSDAQPFQKCSSACMNSLFLVSNQGNSSINRTFFPSFDCRMISFKI